MHQWDNRDESGWCTYSLTSYDKSFWQKAKRQFELLTNIDEFVKEYRFQQNDSVHSYSNYYFMLHAETVSSNYTTDSASLSQTQSGTTAGVASSSAPTTPTRQLMSSMMTLNPSTDFKRTVIFHQLVTTVGQDMLLLGGLDSSRRQGESLYLLSV